MIKNSTPAIITTPEGVDAIASAINARLSSDLDWLTTAYGVVEKKGKQDAKGKDVFYPAIYVGDNEYHNLMPDEHLGNYSFFELKDPVKITGYGLGQPLKIEANLSLVVWFDFNTVYSSATMDNSNVRSVRKLVTDSLKGSINGVSVMIGEIYYKGENVYKGYSFDQVENQYFERPYGGFRIDLTTIYKETNCL